MILDPLEEHTRSSLAYVVNIMRRTKRAGVMHQSSGFAVLQGNYLFLKPGDQFRAKVRADLAVLKSYRSQAAKLQQCLRGSQKPDWHY